MRKSSTYRYTLLTGILFLCIQLSACNPLQTPANITTVANTAAGSSIENSSTTSAVRPALTPVPSHSAGNLAAESSSVSVKPTKVPSETGEKLQVNGTSISLGESKDSILKKLGDPGRIVNTEYDFDYYVYNNNYNKLLFVAVKNKKVVGYYTDSKDFNFKGITPASKISSVSKLLGKDYTLTEVLDYENKSYTAKILMDKIGTQKVIGVYVLSNNVKKDDYTKAVWKNVELLVYDLTNSIRARNELSILSWSSSAAISARKHSLDMAKNNFFDHINPDGQKPGDRLLEDGVSYRSMGENIIAGYGTAILSTHAWFNSSGHRKNILNPKYKSLGVGFTYQPDSHYKTYITQEFFR